jgi:small subunit ribosomal protein S3
VRRPEIDAQLVAEGISLQLEKRIHLKKAMKKAVSSAMYYGAEGIKIKCSGRIGGAEMARSEQEKDGRIPLHTIRADIDYGFAEALTVAGKIGVKVWIFKGEKLSKPDLTKITPDRNEQTSRFESREPRSERRERGQRSRDREKS